MAILPKATPNPAALLCLRKSLRFNRFFIATTPLFYKKNNSVDSSNQNAMVKRYSDFHFNQDHLPLQE
jgi:hypothetical protein